MKKVQKPKSFNLGLIIEYTRKKEFYCQERKLNNIFNDAKYLSLLFLIDKYYKFKIRDGHENLVDWQTITDMNSIKNNSNIYLRITPKLYVIKNAKLDSCYIQDAYCITLLLEENFCIFNLFADLFTDYM